ncbi:MAG: hypothetical protein FWF06_06125 [Symbiobacteriaceae bacterium]|nr:hypothetical protein [Symbiobacteriaceae bacterium]
MSRGGMGVGSASIVLVFAILCLTIFALISLSAASSDKALVDAEVDMVTAYYRADTLAEIILGELVHSRSIPPALQGIGIESRQEQDAVRVFFACPLSDRKELAVEILLFPNHYDILKWRLEDTAVWGFASTIPVWQGTP